MLLEVTQLPADFLGNFDSTETDISGVFFVKSIGGFVLRTPDRCLVFTICDTDETEENFEDESYALEEIALNAKWKAEVCRR